MIFNIKDFEKVRETEKAILLSLKGVEVWVPKSSVKEDGAFKKYMQDELNVKLGSLKIKEYTFSELKQICKFRIELNSAFNPTVTKLQLKNDWKKEFRNENKAGYVITF